MPLEYYTEQPRVNTDATERLTLLESTDRAAQRLFPYACFAVGVVLFLALLARLPSPPVSVEDTAPAYSSYHYEDNRVCIGIAVCN